jgi:Flp pilus assembly protein TadG
MLKHLLQNRLGNVSVETALIAIFVLFPLLAGGSDFIELIAAKAKLNASLPSFYSYAWNNPATATNMTQLNGILTIINQQSGPTVAFPPGAATASYTCVVPPTPPAITTTQIVQSTPCPAADTQENEFVTYALVSNVQIPMPMPFGLTNPFVMSASGKVQIE